MRTKTTVKGNQPPKGSDRVTIHAVERLKASKAVTVKIAKTKPTKADATVLVDFGGITMHVRKPTKAEFKQRVADGVKALSRLSTVLSKPGVKLTLKPDTPSYVADPRDPSLVVQTVNGVSRRGRFARNGRFMEVK